MGRPNVFPVIAATGESTHDVVVIGAGVAGLMATRELAEAGQRVQLVEARERLGGRIFEERPRSWPAPVELGAEFIHGGNRALAAAMRRRTLRRQAVPDRHWLIRKGERKQAPDTWDQINEVMKRIRPRYRGSFGEWLAQFGQGLTKDERQLASSFVKGFQGAPLRRMSAQALFEATKEKDEQSRLAGGYGKLIEAFARQLSTLPVTLALGCTVGEISWRRGAVTVSTQDGKRWRARKALVTIPLGVLGARRGETTARISFTPGLAAKSQLWRRLRTGHAIRLILQMRGDIWRRGIIPAELRAEHGRAFGFLHSDENNFPVWWSAAPAPVLVGWTGGISAENMGSWNDDRIYRAGVQTLARLLDCSGAAVARAIVDWRTHNWTADPFSRGAYSYATAGLEKAPQQLAKPVAGTIFFAGEATADLLELGTVHGALASGERAAKEILAAVRQR